MDVPKDLKNKAKQTREDVVLILQLDEGISLYELCRFAEDMFPGVGDNSPLRRTLSISLLGNFPPLNL